MSFRELNLHPNLLRAVEELGFSKPTPIQQQSIGPALEGRDVLACAQTGSGKTAAFALPVLQRLQGGPRGRVRALVLTPTRELAAQVHEHFTLLGRHTGVRAAAVFGGVGMTPQEKAFREGVDVIVATPGRLLDHLQNGYARLDAVEVLVLDEADRMLDMGFLPDVRRILKHLPAQRQTLFFSATMPAPIMTLSGEMLKNPAGINVERRQAPAKTVAQSIFPVKEELKADLFLELVRRNEVGSVIVFTRTKHRANRLAEFLDKHGVANARIHGNRSQTARTDALAGFKAGRYQVLVATDIVARGIDVEALEHVVNFDVPHVPEDYIHRVGRTGRAEATGDALTFVSPEEEADLRSIERAVGKPLPRRTLQGFDYARRPAERFEVPLAERIKEIRARKADERARAKAKAERKAQLAVDEAARRAPRDGGRPRPAAAAPAASGEGPGRSRRRGGRRPAGDRR